MIDPDSLSTLDTEIHRAVQNDGPVLDALRTEVRILSVPDPAYSATFYDCNFIGRHRCRQNQIEFDPFMVQLVRVVDSSNNEYCLEVVTPTSDIRTVNERHINRSGKAISSLGRMMSFLGVKDLWSLSPMIPRPVHTTDLSMPIKPGWVQVYRELMEWATLFGLVHDTKFGSDTVIVMDGNLRSKIFRGELFLRYRQALEAAIEQHMNGSKRRVYVTGIAKHSKVLQRYRLAMALEGNPAK